MNPMIILLDNISQKKQMITEDSMHNISYSEITKINIVEQAKNDWLKLEENSNNSFFVSWFWITHWAKEAAKETQLYLFRSYINQELVGICFLTISRITRSRGLLRVRQVQINEYKNAKFNMVNQYNNIMCSRAYEQICWNELFNSLNTWEQKWDEISISSIPERALKNINKLSCKFNGIVEKEHCTWWITLDEKESSIEGVLARFKPKSRQQLRQSLRAIKEQYGEIRVTQAKDLEEGKIYFEEMKKMHTKRWQNKGKHGAFSKRCWVNLHTNLVEHGVQSGEVMLLKIFTISKKNSEVSKVLGYLYGHVYHNKIYMQQTGFMVSKDNKIRPGYISHLFAMVFCAKSGLKNYDFLPDEENSYKKFFCTSGYHIYWVTWQKSRIRFFIDNQLRKIFLKS